MQLQKNKIYVCLSLLLDDNNTLILSLLRLYFEKLLVLPVFNLGHLHRLCLSIVDTFDRFLKVWKNNWLQILQKQ